MKTDRRHFLTGTLGTAATLPFLTSSTSQAIPPIHREGEAGLKLSLAGYSLRKEFQSDPPVLDIRDGFMRFACENGLGAIEPTSYYFPKDADSAYFREYRRKAFLMGLTISGTAIGNSYTLPPGPKREEQLALTRKWIDHAVEMGAPCIRIFAGNVQKGFTEEQARAFAIECIREALDYAAEKGVFLALENHGGIVSTADQLLSIVKAVDSPWFGINLDTGNFRTEDPYEDIEKAAPYAITVQLKVEVQPSGGKKEPADLPRVLSILKGVGYRGFVALEYEAAEDALTAIPRHLQTLRRLMS